MLTKDTAICIRAVDYSETSQVLTFFTRATGKISAIAKGSKRPQSAFDGPIEAFSCGDIVFSEPAGEKLATLTEFEQQPRFTHLANSLFALNCASFAIELLNSLTDDYDPHPQLFDSLLQFLQNVSEQRVTGRATISLLILFQLALLKEVGLMPVLNYCVNCKAAFSDAWRGGYFSSAANGIVCRDCEAAFPDRIEVTSSAAKCLLVLSKLVLGAVEGGDLKLLSEADERILNQIEKLLISHFTQTLGRPPKLAKHILK